jgi:hypothetical protein
VGSPSCATGTSAAGTSSEKVVIDPTKGGAVSPKAAQQSKALEVHPGVWIWDGVLKVMEVDLFSAAWEVRHGAAIALRELIKIQGKNGGMRGVHCILHFILRWLIPSQMVLHRMKIKSPMNGGVTILRQSFFVYLSWIVLVISFRTR